MSVSPETVFNWFMASVAEAKGKFRPSFDETFDKELMQRLLARQEPLIDLAIASYCDNVEILEALWQSGDKTIKVAIATNTFRRGFAGLPVATFEQVCSDPDLVRGVFENPSMAHEGLANFLERSGSFEALSNEGWLRGVYYALRNPILRNAPELDRFADDGYLLYSTGRPFDAAWKLLVTLEATDPHAAVLSDAYLNIAVFSPPYEELLKAEGKPRRQDSLAEFSEKYEHGTRLYLDYVLHKWRDLSDKEGDRWPTARAFIRQGAAAGAARHYRKNVIAYLRDHPDKWVRAGYYATFQFFDEASIRAAYEKDRAFFTEHAVYNKVLYHNTSLGRTFRAMVKNNSGHDWEDFSDDQMRRRIYQSQAIRLWKENPLVYSHPGDDLAALKPLPLTREPKESILDFMRRRADELKEQNSARLSQICTWLQEAPQEPQRVLPLIAELIASLHREVQMCVENTAETPGLGQLAAEIKDLKRLVFIAAITLAIIIIYFKH